MRLVDVCGFYTPLGGGIRTYIDQKLELSDGAGVDVTVLAPGLRDETVEVSPRARITYVASPRFPLDRKYFAFADEQAVHAALDRLEPDFIEASSPWRSADYVASFSRAVPRSLVMHSDPLSAHAYRWFERVADPPSVDRAFDWFWRRLRMFGSQFDAVVCANSDLAARLVSGGVENVVTVPMGTEKGLFSPTRRDEAVRRRLLAACGMGPEATLLIAAGRLATEKRIPMLVEAATLAGRTRPIGLAIFGEGRCRDQILRAIGGNPHIRLFEPIRDRTRFATILASADALLHGCEAETFGMIAAEANASGLPVIAPAAGGVADFARLNPGLSFRPRDAQDAARAIESFCSSGLLQEPVAPPRGMEDHFAELFDHYWRLSQVRPAIAA
ncbi:glycosyltransferase [Qipengyuania sp. YG27]|uniref:Glycosyltransferase n=1 Tax=Qipengyuania mesophila TaxID=2867246 RepID=A0ABS7JX70_9SPHN|nr:glycosyltransferase [Qipengyuania mesophila]MBX7502168.1 glycosyltransferase [Qipengyuania mesophila]